MNLAELAPSMLVDADAGEYPVWSVGSAGDLDGDSVGDDGDGLAALTFSDAGWPHGGASYGTTLIFQGY